MQLSREKWRFLSATEAIKPVWIVRNLWCASHDMTKSEKSTPLLKNFKRDGALIFENKAKAATPPTLFY